jgi:deazaflavin-dependent oxidoreductase (nitroreductase family)
MAESLKEGDLEQSVKGALARGGVIDITTTDRRSGRPRRIEVVFHNIDGRIYISGTPSPRRRSWLANLDARPELTLHLKGPVRADLPAHARIIEEESERRRILPPIAGSWRRNDSGLWPSGAWRPSIETMVRQSPFIEITLDPAA